MGKSKSSQQSTKETSTGLAVKKKKIETVCKCVYNNKEKIKSLAQEVTIEIRDMEQLVNRGNQLSACPYYASRESIKYSQVRQFKYCLLYIYIIIYLHIVLYLFVIDSSFTI